MPNTVCPSRFQRLILAQGETFDREVFQASLEALDDGDFLSTMALGWSVFGWLSAFGVTGRRWIFLLVAVDVLLYGLRWRLRRGLGLRPGGRSRSIDDRVAALLLVQGIVVSAEVLYLTSVPSETVVYLGVMLGMSYATYVTALQSVFRLLAVSNLVMVGAALRIGLGTGYSDAVRPLAVIMPIGTLAFFAMIIRVHKTVLGSIRSQVAARRLSLHDPLTKLPNRAYMNQRLDDLLARIGARDESSGVAVLCLDLDGFKAVNDTHGHAAGDLTLIHVARLLDTHMTVRDMACRIGGDEFVLILPEADAQRVRNLGQEIIAEISTPFEIGAETPIRIGASIGATIGREPGLDAATLVMRADMALYEAKRNGKGHVRVVDIRRRSGHS